jgi:hypothetical protein
MEDRVRLERALYREISRPSESSSGSPQQQQQQLLLQHQPLMGTTLGTAHLHTRGVFESTGGSSTSATAALDALPREASSPSPAAAAGRAAGTGTLSATALARAALEEPLLDSTTRGSAVEEAGHAHAD